MTAIYRDEPGTEEPWNELGVDRALERVTLAGLAREIAGLSEEQRQALAEALAVDGAFTGRYALQSSVAANYEPNQLVGQATVTGSAAPISFTSIPADFTDLEIVCWIPGISTTDAFALRVNNDSGSNYTGNRIRTSSTTVTGTNYTAQAYALVSRVPAAGAPPMTCRLWIPNYANTSEQKVILSNYGQYSGSYWEQGQYTWVWASTAAITRLDFGRTAALGNLAVGSTISIYGRG